MSADLTVPPPMQSDVEIAKLHAQHMLAPRNLDFYRFAYAIADARDAIWSERIAALLRAVPPLPVVADLRRGAEECAREGVAGWGNTMSAAADAIAALQARLEAAERSKAELLEALRWMVAGSTQIGVPIHDCLTKARAAIDAATQEKPRAA